MLTPANAAISPRRRPATRRCPTSGIPTSCGVSLAGTQELAHLRPVVHTLDATRVTAGKGCPAGTPDERDFFASAETGCMEARRSC